MAKLAKNRQLLAFQVLALRVIASKNQIRAIIAFDCLKQ